MAEALSAVAMSAVLKRVGQMVQGGLTGVVVGGVGGVEVGGGVRMLVAVGVGLGVGG